MTGLLQIFEVAFAHAVNCHNTDVSRFIYCDKYICSPQAQIMTVTKVGNDTDKRKILKESSQNKEKNQGK